MKALFIIVFSLVGVNLWSQTLLSNTKWKGRIENPQALDIIFEFRNDSLIVSSAEGIELEVMFFSQAKDTLKLRKLNGQSPCNYTTEGIYILNWTDSGEKLLLYPISDNCKARSVSMSAPVAYSRVKS
jgi:cell wall-associated protease